MDAKRKANETTLNSNKSVKKEGNDEAFDLGYYADDDTDLYSENHVSTIGGSSQNNESTHTPDTEPKVVIFSENSYKQLICDEEQHGNEIIHTNESERKKIEVSDSTNENSNDDHLLGKIIDIRKR